MFEYVDSIMAVLEKDLPKRNWMTVSRVHTLVNDHLNMESDDDDDGVSEEAIAVELGVLIEQGYVEFDTYTHWRGRPNYIVRRSEIPEVETDVIPCKPAAIRS